MILVGTDFHFGARNDEEIIIKNQLQFLDNVFFPTIESRGVTHFFDLGDTWDKRKVHNIRTYNIFRKHFFERLNDMGIETIMLIGNHDIYYKNTNDENSISSLAGDYKNIHVVNGFEDITVNGCTFGMMSWINNENHAEAVKFAKEDSRADIICGHFEAQGFQMLPGILAEHGIDSNIFNRFSDVWSGHFHIPSRKGNFEYIGNPFDLNWSDYGTRKSVMLFDEEKRAKEYIENPYRLFDLTRYTDEVDVVNFDYDKYAGKFIRVMLESFKVADNSKLGIFLDNMQRVAYNLDVVEDGRLSIDDMSGDDEPEIENATDMLTKIINVVNSMDLDGLDKSKLSQYTRDLYQEASEVMAK